MLPVFSGYKICNKIEAEQSPEHLFLQSPVRGMGKLKESDSFTQEAYL
jgi:hypothetical protein